MIIVSSIENFQLFGVKELWRYDGILQLQEEEGPEKEEIISRSTITEVYKQEINLHLNNPRWTKVKQTLVLKGRQMDSLIRELQCHCIA